MLGSQHLKVGLAVHPPVTLVLWPRVALGGEKTWEESKRDGVGEGQTEKDWEVNVTRVCEVM